MEKKVSSVKVLATTSMNPFDVLDVCKDIAKNKFGFGLVVRSTVRFKSPKTTEKDWKALFGSDMDVIKITKVTNARAYDYVKAVNNQLSKQGEDKSFVGDKMLGYEWLVKNILKASTKEGIEDKDRMQFCITFKDSDKTKFESFYIVGGDRFATDKELEFIKSHIYKAPSKSRKQEDCGISDEDIIQVRNYKVSNVAFCGKSADVASYWDSFSK